MPILGWGLIALGISCVFLAYFKLVAKAILIGSGKKSGKGDETFTFLVGIVAVLGGIVVLNAF